jgi:hypothetical protein
LSVEHVPPKALGRDELVLTCKRCNNDAGRHFDAEAHKQQRLWQFLSGQSQQPETARFTVGDITTRVEAHVTGQTGLFLMEVPKINNPADLERMEAHMRMLSETRSTDFRFTVTPQLRYFPDRARVSWIRTAYLAAFALFGWKYILQPALPPIREQLMNPLTITLPLLSMYDPNGDPGRHEAWAIKQPTEHRSLLVISGQQGVFCLSLMTRGASKNSLAASVLAQTSRSATPSPGTCSRGRRGRSTCLIRHPSPHSTTGFVRVA